ncbi:MAG: hypothetical protein ABIJ40_02920 [Bacteroidota bacterium]
MKLRVINFFGAATFATYGLLIGVNPVLLLNGFITLVDIYYLVDMFKKNDQFGLIEVNLKNHEYIRRNIYLQRSVGSRY